MEKGREPLCTDANDINEASHKKPPKFTASSAVLASVLATLPSVCTVAGVVGSAAALSGCSQTTHRTTFYTPVSRYQRPYLVNDWLQNRPLPTNPPQKKTAESSKINIKVKEPFDFATFDPGPKGVIAERHAAPMSKKHVVYIPDYHLNGESSNFQNGVHGEIYGIVEGMVEKYGTVPLTVENWVEGRTAATFLENVWPSNPLYNLFNTADLGARKAMASGLIKNGLASGYVLLGTYQDEVVPIGTLASNDLNGIHSSRKKDQQLQKAYTSKSFCEGTDGRNYGVNAVMRGFKAGYSSKTTHCYCGLHAVEKDVLQEVKHRVNDVPRHEVGNALSFNHNFVVVIAGYKHLNAAKDEMKRRGVNYVVVAPKSLAPKLRGWVTEEYITENYPDNESGTCAGMIRENNALVARTMRNIDQL